MHPDFKPHKPVTFEQLQAIMDTPVLVTDQLPEPVIIESLSLYRRDKAWFLKVRGTRGGNCPMFRPGFLSSPAAEKIPSPCNWEGCPQAGRNPKYNFCH